MLRSIHNDEAYSNWQHLQVPLQIAIPVAPQDGRAEPFKDDAVRVAELESFLGGHGDAVHTPCLYQGGSAMGKGCFAARIHCL